MEENKSKTGARGVKIDVSREGLNYHFREGGGYHFRTKYRPVGWR
jgi:hypothetical protein